MAPPPAPLSSRSTNSLNQPQRHAMRDNVDLKQAAIQASPSDPDEIENETRDIQSRQLENPEQEEEGEPELQHSGEAHRQESPMRQQQLQHRFRPGQANLNQGNPPVNIRHVYSSVQNFIIKVRDRFQANPEIVQQFGAMVGSRPARDLLPSLAQLFGNARDLYQEFKANANQFDQYNHQVSLQRRNPPNPAPSTTPRTNRHVPDGNTSNNSSHNYTATGRDSDDDDDDSDDDDGDDDDDDDVGSQYDGVGGSQYDGDDGTMYGMFDHLDSSMGFGRLERLGSPKLDDSQRKEIQKLLSMPDIDIPSKHRKQTPTAMSCTLMEHQKVALTWMAQQEEDQHKKGGLLADTMGLGKTISALALVLDRPSTNPSRKTTLVVAPLSLLKQWEREIETRVKPRYRLKTIIYHGKARHGMTAAKLLRYDIVLTTYGIVLSEGHKKGKNKTPILISPDVHFHRVFLDEAHNIKNRNAKSSIAAARIRATYRWCLTGTPFMNRTNELYALLRFLQIKPYNEWRAFSYGIDKPMKSLNEDYQGEAMQKLQAVFRSITLRRTKASTLDGKPIIVLPKLIKEEAMTTFNEEQKAFYDALEAKQKLKFNRFLKAGMQMKMYTYILVLLLRLRQACCHPHLIKDFGIPEGAQVGADEMRDLAKKLKRDVVERLKGQTEFECPVCRDMTESPLILFPCGHPICNTCFTALMEVRDPNNDDIYPCHYPQCKEGIDPEGVICHCFFMEVHMPEKLDSEAGEVDEDDLEDESDGFESFDDDDDVDARGNLKGFIASSSEDEDEDDEEEVKDEDSDSFTETKSKKLPVSADDPSTSVSKEELVEEKPALDDSDSDSLPSLDVVMARVKAKSLRTKRETISRSPTPELLPRFKMPVKKESQTNGKRKRSSDKEPGRSKKKSKRNNGASKKSKGKKRKKAKFVSLADLKKAGSKNPAAKAKYLKRLRQDWVPSAKIEKTMELLEEIRANNPKEKTLIFSLWTSFLDLLEIPIHDQGFQYVRYDGSMGPNERNMAVRDFMDKPNVQIMMVSLTAGNTGLNLTAATQVIILEPFWNPFVEEQAVDRAHRIGQKKEVTVHRLLIQDTVEDRIRALQEKKRGLVNTALSEEGAQGVGRLTMKELSGLFGLKTN